MQFQRTSNGSPLALLFTKVYVVCTTASQLPGHVGWPCSPHGNEATSQSHGIWMQSQYMAEMDALNTLIGLGPFALLLQMLLQRS